MSTFIFPTGIAVLVAVAAFFWGGTQALILTLILAILEVTLSFDNAVVNAKVLQRMDPVWQRRFLVWGIPVAVFGTRFVLPILIVAAAAALSPIVVTKLAIFSPALYGEHLAGAHVAIAAFGSAFLLLVSLKYFFDDEKSVHWISMLERRFSKWGGIEAIEIAIVLVTLMVCAFFVPHEAGTLLMAGLIGVVLFIAIEGVAESFEMQEAAAAGAALFVYLNVLDSAFSLDGVVGAFAITTMLPIIIGGLGIGALFVRSFTVALVRAKTLDALPYLEHGAHYAIFGLAIAMLAGIFVHVPETITGLIGLFFIALAYWSSRKHVQSVHASA